MSLFNRQSEIGAPAAPVSSPNTAGTPPSASHDSASERHPPALVDAPLPYLGSANPGMQPPDDIIEDPANLHSLDTSHTASSLPSTVVQTTQPPTPQRPQAPPSLLTQALATARGIPSHPKSGTSINPPPRYTHNHQSPTKVKQEPPASTLNTHQPSYQRREQKQPSAGVATGSHPEHGESLPSQPTTMASSTAVTTMTSALPTREVASGPASFNQEPLGILRDANHSGRNTPRDQSRRTSTSLEIDRRTFFFDHDPFLNYSTTESSSSATSKTPTAGNYFATIDDIAPESTASASDIADPSTQRPRKVDHRFAAGTEVTEKVWSIGAGEGSDEDGLVEQSVAEAMAGLEPNARSRKASYSLRFFKEGLPPEDKPRRKDTKQSYRDRRLSTTTEESIDTDSVEPSDTDSLAEVIEDTTNTITPKMEPVASPKKKAEDLTSTADAVTPKSRSTGPTSEVEFLDLDEQSVRALPPQIIQTGQHDGVLASPIKVGPSTSVGAEVAAQPDEMETADRADAGDSQDSGDADADESGEEKISSAVFLPHQELPESRPCDDARVDTTTPSQTGSLAQSKSHPWLVKADEPEVELDIPTDLGAKQDELPLPQPQSQLREELPSRPKDVPKSAPSDRPREVQLSVTKQPGSNAPITVAPAEDQAARDPSNQSKEPLEAIELIPYKHQVGGHTTIWRFSRRAVCKQLNNRENEFYETIERYHRDLLAFLPRYIGVLNVTFQREARRRSVSKKDDQATVDRKKIQGEVANAADAPVNGSSGDSNVAPAARIISESLAHNNVSVPTVTFNDNKHILPRNLLQPLPPIDYNRRRSTPMSKASSLPPHTRPQMESRPNSWGATTINKRLRNEVFNDAFLKQPVEVQRHRRPHQKSVPRPTMQRLLRPSNSDPNLVPAPESPVKIEPLTPIIPPSPSLRPQSQSDLGPEITVLASEPVEGEAVKDITGTSAPEPETLHGNPLGTKKKRRYSAGGLRRKPQDVRDNRGDLKYFEEADDVDVKHTSDERHKEETPAAIPISKGSTTPVAPALEIVPSAAASTVGSEAPSPTVEFKKIPRPVNPKEAKTRRDRVEYFLLLEDLTAGMKRPCMMDLKMGTRQYGVEATAKKQRSQQEKCLTTTSAELGFRICGLQVWNAKTQSYDFQDKYYGRRVKAGAELQSALQRFLYNGVELQSVLRHIPIVLQKLSQLEHIVQGLRGYRFYAASLLIFYDGDTSEDGTNGYETMYDSTTDFATDTEENYRRSKKRNPRDIDFKVADFANSVTPFDNIDEKPCPPQHPNQPDGGFLKGLRSLRKYFLAIQRDVRAELGLDPLGRAAARMEEFEMEQEEDDGMISL